MLPAQASGAYGVSFEIDISRGDDLSLKEHWQDHAQAANGNGSKRAAAEADGGKKRRRKVPKMPKSGTYFETVPFNEDDFKLKDDAAGSKTR
mmetsp:Transcript_26235/g.73631  ORF Transcript_26235/g.73631 Transcript_26235/m.73631 type:complete len:92 (-) Transcript_26235:22-297(-)